MTFSTPSSADPQDSRTELDSVQTRGGPAPATPARDGWHPTRVLAYVAVVGGGLLAGAFVGLITAFATGLIGIC
jgi:hypothetical protein